LTTPWKPLGVEAEVTERRRVESSRAVNWTMRSDRAYRTSIISIKTDVGPAGALSTASPNARRRQDSNVVWAIQLVCSSL
jgi:hypothetical protein